MANDLEKRITAKMVLDSTGFNDGLKGVNSQLKLAQSELKSASASVGAFGRDSEKLRSVQEALAKQVELQAKKVDIYKDSIEKTTSKMNENIQARDELQKKLGEEKSKYEEVVKLYGKESDEAKKAKESVDNLAEEYKKKEKAVESNAKQINNYTTNLNKANAEMIKTQGELGKVTKELKEQDNKWISASKSLKEHGDHLKSVGEKVGGVGDSILKLNAPLVAVGIAAGKVGMDFESQMSRVKAISGATGEEFQKLNDQALKLGADTAFSAKEAALGMENLASAGFSVNEIMVAMPGMLDLAASSGEDLANSADIAASTLRGFGLEASQAGHVADVLAKNASATNAAVADTGEAMKYVAPVAKAMGLSLEEVTAAIGEMANAGVKGSQAGTTLRGALSRLADPSKEAATAMAQIGFSAFDSSGKLLPLKDLIDRLQQSTKNLTDKQKEQAISTIFGQEAMSGMLTLIQAGPTEFDKLTQSLKNSDGAAKEMATTMQDNAKASVEQMFGSLETAGIKIEQAIAPSIRNLADTVGNLADKFANLSPETQEAIVKAVGFSVALGGVLKIGGGVIGAVGSMAGGLSKLTGLMGAATVATETVGVAATAAAGTAGAGGVAGLGTALGGAAVAAAPWLAVGAAVAGTGYLIYKGMAQEAIPAVDLFADKVQQDNTKVVNSFNDMSSKVSASAENSSASVIKISDATQKAVGAYIKMDDDTKKALTDMYVNSSTFTDQAKNTVVAKYTEMTNSVTKLSGDVKNNSINKFKELVAGMGTLSDANKNTVIAKYAEMVNQTSGLSQQQKDKIIADFKQTLVQSTAITEQQKNTLVKKYVDMSNMIKGGMDKHYQDEYNSMQQFFQRSNALTDEEEKKALENLTKSNNDKKSQIDAYEQQIQSILQNAANNHRQITADEQQQINSIQENMKANAIRSLSENEIEAKVIMDRIKDYGSRITAEQASEVIKNAEKQRVESVDKANRQYEETKATIEHMRDDTHSITADQAEKLIADAEKQRDGSINKANELKDGVVDKINSMNSDIGNSVDTSTGRILTHWDRLKSWWDNWNPGAKTFTIMENKVSASQMNERWTGDNYFKGGFTTLHERGYELYDLPRSTRIYNHEASEELVKQTAESVATKVANNVLAAGVQGEGSQIIIQNMNVRNDNDVKLIARELYNLQNQKRRALGVT